MTLLELCEPLFEYVCRLNRAGRKGGGFEYAVVRADVKALFDQMKSASAADPRLAAQYSEVTMPLTFFVDSMICESALPIAGQWHKTRLAYEHKELAGDEKFYDLLDETLAIPDEEASERLAIFYTCMGLGFTGACFDPQELKKKMLAMAPRLRHLMESDETVRICPEAYGGVDERDLIQPPGHKMAIVGIFFLVFTLTALAVNVFNFRAASGELRVYLNRILQQDVHLKE